MRWLLLVLRICFLALFFLLILLLRFYLGELCCSSCTLLLIALLLLDSLLLVLVLVRCNLIPFFEIFNSSVSAITLRNDWVEEIVQKVNLLILLDNCFLLIGDLIFFGAKLLKEI